MAFCDSCFYTPRHGLDFDDGRMFVTPCQLWRMLNQSKFWFACLAATPCAALAGVLKYWQTYVDEDGVQSLAMDQNAYSSLTFLMVFLMGFRVQAAYQKFWNGLDFTYGMVGDLWDSGSSLFAFTIGGKGSPQRIKEFRHLIVRLYSLQGALMFGELEKRTTKSVLEAYDMELIDASGLDPGCLAELKNATCKAETNFQWIQQLIVEANNEGVFSVAPPIVSRVFADLGSSMQKFHDAEKTADVPFPFPYTIALQALLYIHWALTFYAATGWSDYVAGCAAFTFAVIFCLWYFVGVALEMDRPFSNFVNSIDKHYIQQEFNARLRTLLQVVEKNRRPKLKPDYRQDISEAPSVTHVRDKTFAEVMAATGRSGMLTKGFSAYSSAPENVAVVVPAQEVKTAEPAKPQQQQQGQAGSAAESKEDPKDLAEALELLEELIGPGGEKKGQSSSTAPATAQVSQDAKNNSSEAAAKVELPNSVGDASSSQAPAGQKQ
eukprot:TRINITY_DN4282_c0_g1_i5.p1 TRINITY_DN4282_c0_g1~~TRINITY_DN4282_c0_g1_i5.p1  ORF type:complete len:492 (-),score=92.98 TRINITY_DN4282_c0_g1_i5:228-1703(-)